MGLLGLFLMSALDSSFLVLPFGNDLLLIAFISSDRNSPMWIAYVIVSAIGSLAGVFIVDALIRKYGYCGTPKVMQLYRQNADMQDLAHATAHFADRQRRAGGYHSGSAFQLP